MIPFPQGFSLGDLLVERFDTAFDRATIGRFRRTREEGAERFYRLLELAQPLVHAPQVELEYRVGVELVGTQQQFLRFLQLSFPIIPFALFEQLNRSSVVRIALPTMASTREKQRGGECSDKQHATGHGANGARCGSEWHLLSWIVAVYFEPPVRSIGRYQVAGRLATGGMGEILLAQLRGPGGFERAVVIKRILPHLAEQEAAVKMFLDEARIAAGIRHPNVTQVQELLQEDGNLCIVMEYLEGESLSGIMRRMRSKGRVMELSSCAHIVAELAAGLHAAHELRDANGQPGGLVHRDVSPQNTFVTYEGSVKVLDFGVAYFHDRKTRTQTGTLRGKFEYMSPEQCLAKELDRRSDVFALGVVLYELTTGHRLFRRKNQLLTLRAIVEEPVVSPRTIVPDYPDELEAVVLRALAKEPKDRYQTAADMRRDLVQVAHRLAPRELPDQALASMMAELFSDRGQEKRAMLQRLRAGAAIEHLPEAEVDEDVELPTVDEPRPSVLTRHDADTVEEQTEDRNKRFSWSFLAWGASALALVGLTVLIVATRPGAEAPAAPVDTSVAPVPATASAEPAASAARSPQAVRHRESPASSVTLHVESIPPGATVMFDGRNEGKTPMDLEVPRDDEPTSVSLQLPGYHPVTEEVVANVEQRLRLVMRPVGRAPRPPKPTATASGFRRFD